MAPLEYTLFATTVGSCGISWHADSITGVQLPERSEAATVARLRRRHPDARPAAPPSAIQSVIDDIGALLRGQPRDFADVSLDMDELPAFNQRVYAVARTIPFGATLSYGEIAARLGDRAAARDVGDAMGRNPFPIIVPCHRVLAAGGKMGGFSAAGGVTTKLRLLAIEGVQVGDPPTLFDSLPLAVRPGRR